MLDELEIKKLKKRVYNAETMISILCGVVFTLWVIIILIVSKRLPTQLL